MPTIHPTALVEPGVEIGRGTVVWDGVHIRGPRTVIGRECVVGEKTYIAYGVAIGDRVKINAQVYVCTGVTIETGVMISAGTIFTNDRYPRATTPDLGRLRASEPDEDTLETTVREGVTVGAGAVIGPGLELGRFSMVGMGSVVTRSVSSFHLVVGNPARPTTVVCRCGAPVLSLDSEYAARHTKGTCSRCGRSYLVTNGLVEEV